MTVARRADFFFDVYLGLGLGESCIYTGDGVDDLDRLSSLIASGTNVGATFVVDVGSQYSSYRPFDLEDIAAIRAQYVSFYGNVNKPNAYTSEPPVAIET